jgi:hypothetical protein
LKNDDYFTCKSKIIDEDDQTEANEFRWCEDLFCHKRLKGGDPKGFNGTSDENSDENYEEEDDKSIMFDQEFMLKINEVNSEIVLWQMGYERLVQEESG